jgi:hypothetical protein
MLAIWRAWSVTKSVAYWYLYGLKLLIGASSEERSHHFGGLLELSSHESLQPTNRIGFK